MKIETMRAEAATADVPDAEMTARVFTALATFMEAHRDEDVPTLLGHIERLRAILWSRLPGGGRGESCDTRAEASATPARVLRIADVCDRVGLGRTTVYRLESKGEFPARRRIGAGAAGWLEEEVDEWIRSQEIAG